jgi:TrwC relaxase/AAA domain
MGFGVRPGTASGALEMARYYLETDTLSPKQGTRAAYYMGEMPLQPQAAVDQSAAIMALVDAEIALTQAGQTVDRTAIETRVAADLRQRPEFFPAASAEQQTVAHLRRDISPGMAELLGIADVHQHITTEGLANLLRGRRLDGQRIQGRVERSGSVTVSEVFGLERTEVAADKSRAKPPGAEAITHILAGRRMDGAAPVYASGKAVASDAVEGAVKRFKAIYNLPTHREPNADELAHMAAGRTANGGFLTATDYRRQIHATRERVTHFEFTLTFHKSVGVAWGLASEPERARIAAVIQDAVDRTMHYAEERFGWARRGDAGKGGMEKGEIAWIAMPHYLARPTIDIERMNADGTTWNERMVVPMRTSDPMPHVHVIAPNVVKSAGGHVGSIDEKLFGDNVLPELNGVLQAHLAKSLRASGVDVALDADKRATRIMAIPECVNTEFSKRSVEGETRAREYANAHGLDWDALSGAQRSELLRTEIEALRQHKEKPDPTKATTDIFADWQAQAKAIGYNHRSMLRPDEVKPELSNEKRHEKGREIALKLYDRELQANAVSVGGKLREIAALSLVEAGIDHPKADIDAITQGFRERGVMQDGELTTLEWTTAINSVGLRYSKVTTSKHIAREKDIIEMTKAAGADLTAALTAEQIDRAAGRYLAQHAKIDASGQHWKDQRAMMAGLAHARVSFGTGAAGSGKSTIMSALVPAWQEDGRKVIGSTVAWRQTGDFAAAGIGEDQRIALTPLLKGLKNSKIEVDDRTVVILDEVGLVGNSQLHELLRHREKHNFQLVMIGDSKQLSSIEAGNVIRLLTEGLGEEKIPAILNSIRQKTERERTITGLWRDRKAAQALEMKFADGSAELIAGGQGGLVNRAADRYQQRMTENRHDPDYRYLVTTKTNVGVMAISAAIRDRRRIAGELGSDRIEKAAVDISGNSYRLKLATGDRVRFYSKVYDADTPRRGKQVAVNGQTAVVTGITEAGLAVRNEVNGVEGTVAWKSLQDYKGAPVKLGYGYAATGFNSQSMTVTDSLHVSFEGSRTENAFLIYTVKSRHERGAELMLNEAAEYQNVVSQRMAGSDRTVSRQDLIDNVGVNYSRQVESANATDLLTVAAKMQRGTLAGFQVGAVAQHEQEHTMEKTHDPDRPRITQAERDAARAAYRPSQEDIAQQTIVQEVQRQQEQDRSEGLER